MINNKNPINILVVSSKYPPEYAGSGLRAHNTYKRLSKKFNINFKVICNSVEFSGNGKYKHDGVDVYRISSKFLNSNIAGKMYKINKFLGRILFYEPKFLIESLYTLRFLCRRDYDLIHTFGYSASTSIAIMWADLMHIPLIVEYVNMTTRKKFTPYRWIPFFLRIFYRPDYNKKSTQLIAISEGLGQFLKEKGLAKNLWIRPNPVDEGRFYSDRKRKYELRKRLTKFMPDDKVLLYLAKWIPRKKHIFLIDVFKKLPGNFKLILGGPMVAGGLHFKRDSSLFTEVQDKIKEYGLEDRVELIRSFVPNFEDYMKLSDMFLFPAIDEGCGTPLLEALACSIPVIANNLEGVFDSWIVNGKNGFLCNLAPDLWARRIREAIDIDEKFLKDSSIKVLKGASTEVIDNKYYEIIQNLISSRDNGKKE